jgi:PIN domain nuclease of toxin-antitoxin system
MDLRMSDLPFNDVANVAVGESWTRDPFDRMIVAHARLDGVAPLISADARVRANYIRALW